MLYIIYGDNQIERYKAYEKVGKANLILNKESISPMDILLSHINSVNLWGESQIIFISDLISDKDFREAFYDHLEQIKNSDNKFVIDEVNINAATVTKLKAFSTKIYNTGLSIHQSEEAKKVNTPFLLCDYIAARDKKRAWIELMRLYQTDIDSEPLHGAIWWKWKIMWTGNNKPNEIYSKEDLARLGHDLIMIPLRAHNGECDFRTEIERWILSI